MSLVYRSAPTECLRKWAGAWPPSGEGIATPPTHYCVPGDIRGAWQRTAQLSVRMFIGDQWRQIKDLLSSGATGRCQKEIP